MKTYKYFQPSSGVGAYINFNRLRKKHILYAESQEKL